MNMDTSSTSSVPTLNPHASYLIDNLTDMLIEYEVIQAELATLKRRQEEIKAQNTYLRIENMILKRVLSADLIADLRREARTYLCFIFLPKALTLA